MNQEQKDLRIAAGRLAVKAMLELLDNHRNSYPPREWRQIVMEGRRMMRRYTRLLPVTQGQPDIDLQYTKRLSEYLLQNNEQLKRRTLMIIHRSFEPCSACHNGRYNFKTDGDGHNAPTDGLGCWHLSLVKIHGNGKVTCPQWRKPY
jgi:hypothetical protein